MVIAADLYARCEAAFVAGPLRAAVAASMAIPGLLRPVEIGGRVLVDGGAVNPVPFDDLRGGADIVVAIDVSGRRRPKPRGMPEPLELPVRHAPGDDQRPSSRRSSSTARPTS